MIITEAKILEELKQIRKNGKSAQERMKAEGILFSNDGKKSQKIADFFEVTHQTVFQWFRDFKTDGISSLKCSNGRGRKLLLQSDEQKEIIKKQINAYPHQPKKAFAHSMEELQLNINYETFKRFLYPRGRFRTKSTQSKL